MTDSSSNKKMTNGIVFSVLFLIVTAIVLVFAGMTGDVSSSQSGFVTEIINSVLHFVGITLDASQLDTLAFFTRKLLGHFLIFAVDGAFFLLAFHAFWPSFNKWWAALVSVSSLLIVAMISELIQLFTSGRSGNWIDIAIDMSGALVGIGIVFLCLYTRKKPL